MTANTKALDCSIFHGSQNQKALQGLWASLATQAKRTGQKVILDEEVCRYPEAQMALRSSERWVKAEVTDPWLDGIVQPILTKEIHSLAEFTVALIDSPTVYCSPGFSEDEILVTDATRRWETMTVSHTDGTWKVNGSIVRRLGVMGVGLGAYPVPMGLLSVEQTMGLLAQMLDAMGVGALASTGRVFGPESAADGNSALTPRGLSFRTECVFGVALLRCTDAGAVLEKASAEDVCDFSWWLWHLRGVPHLIDQQGRYGFTAGPNTDFGWTRGQWDGKTLTVSGKTAKHLRVDTGAFVLHTGREDCTVGPYPVVMGRWEECHDGVLWMPQKLVAGLHGWLNESVSWREDLELTPKQLEQMSLELLVGIGDEVRPGAPVARVWYDADTYREFHWNSKAGYGLVSKVEISGLAFRVGVEAHFEGAGKARGPIKAMVGSLESARMTVDVEYESGIDFSVLGAQGLVKDGLAFADYVVGDIEPCVATVSILCAQETYVAYLKKYGVEDGDTWVSADGTLTKTFSKRMVTTTDTRAEKCQLRFMLESTPVHQSIGRAAFSAPQLAVLCGRPAGRTWVTQEVMPRVRKHMKRMTWLAAVAHGQAPADCVVNPELPEDNGHDEALLSKLAALYPKGFVWSVTSPVNHETRSMWVLPRELQRDIQDGEAKGLADLMLRILRMTSVTLQNGAYILMNAVRGAARERLQSRGCSQPHMVRFGYAQKVILADCVPDGELWVHPGNPLAIAAARDKWECGLVDRAPAVAPLFVRVVVTESAPRHMVLCSRRAFRAANLGDADGDLMSFFPMKDYELWEKMRRENLDIADPCKLVLGVSADDVSLGRWGEMPEKASADKRAVEYSKTLDEWLEDHYQSARDCYEYVGMAYRLTNVATILGGLCMAGARTAGVLGGTLEEEVFLAMQGRHHGGLREAMKAWMQAKGQGSWQASLAGWSAGVSNAQVWQACELASQVNNTLILKPIPMLARALWLMDRGLWFTTDKRVVEMREALKLLGKSIELPEIISDHPLVEIVRTMAKIPCPPGKSSGYDSDDY